MAEDQSTPRKDEKVPFDAGQLYRMDRKLDLARHVTNWVGVIAVFAIIGWWISMISGKNTYFELFSEAVIDLNLNEWCAWAVAGLFGLNSWRLSKARKDVIERYHPFRKAFEESVDPQRTSSGKLGSGETANDRG